MPTLLAVPAQCPKCGSQGLWDNRATKTNPKAPDFKCKNKACDGVVWSPKPGQVWADMAAPAPVATPQSFTAGPHIPGLDGPALTHEAMKAEALNNVLGAYSICFGHALSLAKRAAPDVALTLDGVSAMTATMLITAKEKGLVQVPYEPGRFCRGMERGVIRLGPRQFAVEGRQQPVYYVDLDQSPACFCRDQEFRDVMCLHEIAARLQNMEMTFVYALQNELERREAFAA